MADINANPDQSYFDWLKQQLFGAMPTKIDPSIPFNLQPSNEGTVVNADPNSMGFVNLPPVDFSVPKIVPSGLPASYEDRTKGKKVSGIDFPVNNGAAFQQGLAVSDQPDFTVGQPFQTPYAGRPNIPAPQAKTPLTPQQSLLTRLFPGYNTGNSATAGTTLQSDYNPVNNPDSMWADTETTKPKTPEQIQRELDRAYEVSRQVANGAGNIGNSSASDVTLPFQSMIAARPDVSPQFQSMIAARPDVPALAQSTGMPSASNAPANTVLTPDTSPQLPSLFAAKPDYPGSNMLTGPSAAAAPVAAAAAPAAVSNGNPVAAGTQDNSNTAPSQGGVGGFLQNLLGGGANYDPQAINPNTGLTNAQTRLMMFNNMANLGFKLAAMGQQMTPAQRAQIMSSMGEGLTTPQAISAMQTQLLQQQKMSRENAQQANFVKIMQSPETINAINNLPKEYQVSAKALAAAGTPEAFVKLQEYLAPHIQGNNIIDYSKGIVRNTDTQMETPIGTGNSAAGQNGSTSNFWTETDSEKAKALLPQRTQIIVDGIIDGSIAIPPISARNKDMTQYLMMAKKIDPTLDTSEMNGRSMIKKSFADSENKSSLFNQRSVLGTFAQHTNSTLDKAQKLNNGPLPAFDAVRNEFLNASGDPRVAEFNTELHMLQGEVGKMVRAGVLTDQEQSSLNSNISAAKSPEQIRGVLDSYNELVSGRIAAVDSSTKAAMGKGYDPTKYSLITPETQKAFDKFNGNNWGRPQTQTSSGAPAVGAVLKGYKFKGGNPADKNNWELVQ